MIGGGGGAGGLSAGGLRPLTLHRREQLGDALALAITASSTS